MILQNLEEKEKEGLGILLHICNDYEYQSLCMFQRMVPEYDLIVNRIVIYVMEEEKYM